MTRLAELRALLAKSKEDGPLEYREDMGEEMGSVAHMTERGKAFYRLQGEAVRLFPALLDVAELAVRAIADIDDDPRNFLEAREFGNGPCEPCDMGREDPHTILAHHSVSACMDIMWRLKEAVAKIEAITDVIGDNK